MRRREVITGLSSAAAWPFTTRAQQDAGDSPQIAAAPKRSGHHGAEMKSRITALAAYNNALWCDAVCRAHDHPGEFHEALWFTRLGAPRFYPDAVTIGDVEAAPAQTEAIAALVGSTRQREWSVKDSFQSLDLKSLGFEPLFDAEWIALSGPLPDVARTEYRSSIVTSTVGLIAWEQCWAGEEVNATAVSRPRVFMPGLLADTNVVFVSIKRDDGIVGGGILNQGADVVGLSNLFGFPIDVVWRSLVATAGEIFPGLPLVGYERGDDLAAAHQAGFETVGPLRVWRLPARAL
jgi:hypothetical protein